MGGNDTPGAGVAGDAHQAVIISQAEDSWILALPSAPRHTDPQVRPVEMLNQQVYGGTIEERLIRKDKHTGPKT